MRSSQQNVLEAQSCKSLFSSCTNKLASRRFADLETLKEPPDVSPAPNANPACNVKMHGQREREHNTKTSACEGAELQGSDASYDFHGAYPCGASVRVGQESRAAFQGTVMGLSLCAHKLGGSTCNG